MPPTRAPGAGPGAGRRLSPVAAPALPSPAGLRFAAPPRRPPEHRVASALAGLGASGLLVVLMVLGVAGADAYDRIAARERPAPPPERVTFVDREPVPIPMPEPIAPPPALPASPTTATPPTAPAAPTRRIPLPGARPAAPVAPIVRDTGAVRSAPGSRIPPPPRAVLPGDRITFPPPAVGRAPDGVRAGVATGPVPLDSAGRAERLREISAGVAEAARRRGGGTGGSMGVPEPTGDATRPRPVGGVSLAIGLPGGGPTAAERRRNREADANIQASLTRVRARLDSLKADSVRRADSVRAARRPPG